VFALRPAGQTRGVLCQPHWQGTFGCGRFANLAEIHKVNDRVRAALKSRHQLGDEEHTVTALESVDLTDAQKRDPRFHTDKTVFVFNQDTAGFRQGRDRSSEGASRRRGLWSKVEKKIRVIRFQHLSRLAFCQPRELALAFGDRLQLKANSRAARGQRLVNGELVTVNKVLADGRIKLQDGRVLGNDYRRFVRGFAITSYASQRQDSGLRPVFRLDRQGRDQPAAVVCHDFAGTQGDTDFHQRQGATTGKTSAGRVTANWPWTWLGRSGKDGT